VAETAISIMPANGMPLKLNKVPDHALTGAAV